MVPRENPKMCHGHPTLSLSCHPPTAAGVCAGNGTCYSMVREIQFEWRAVSVRMEQIKVASNLQKHGVSFELASSVFNDPRLLTVADLVAYE